LPTPASIGDQRVGPMAATTPSPSPAMTTLPRGGTGPPLDTWLGIRPHEWCEPWPWVYTYACHKYVTCPVWWSIIVGDVVGVWFIAAILLRQRQQDKEVRQRRLAIPKAVRARRAWKSVAASVRLASMRAAKENRWEGACAWRNSWESVAKSRAERRDYLHKLDYNLAAVMTRATGPVMFTVVVALIMFETHAFYSLAVPWMNLDEVTGWWFVRIMGVFPARIFLNLARTTFTDPGRPEATDDDGGAKDAMPASVWPGCDVEMCSGSDGRGTRRCGRCGTSKPERCHHCKVCRRCVLKMDHHCPIVNNCIGRGNHRYFCFFLFDVTVACFLISCLMAGLAAKVVIFPSPKMTVAFRIHVLAAFLLAMLVQCTIGPFFIFHLRLVLANETTLEFLGRRKSRRKRNAKAKELKEYSRGVMENFVESCGAPPACLRPTIERCLLWLMPANVARLAKRSA